MHARAFRRYHRPFWWIAPFVFVFTLLRAVQETIRGGEKNVIYGVAAAVSLIVIVIAIT